MGDGVGRGEDVCKAAASCRTRMPRLAVLPGAQAMTATADRHLPEEAATRVVPAVAPLAIDPVPEVRAPEH